MKHGNDVGQSYVKSRDGSEGFLLPSAGGLRGSSLPAGRHGRGEARERRQPELREEQARGKAALLAEAEARLAAKWGWTPWGCAGTGTQLSITNDDAWGSEGCGKGPPQESGGGKDGWSGGGACSSSDPTWGGSGKKGWGLWGKDQGKDAWGAGGDGEGVGGGSKDQFGSAACDGKACGGWGPKDAWRSGGSDGKGKFGGKDIKGRGEEDGWGGWGGKCAAGGKDDEWGGGARG